MLVTALLLAAVPCDAERAAASRWLVDLASVADRSSAMVSPDVHLVKRSGDAVPAGITVQLSVRETLVSGRPAANVQKALSQQLQRHQLIAVRAEAPPVLLLVDRDVRWKSVAGAAQAIRDAGLKGVVIAFEEQPPVAAPGPSSIDADLDRIAKNPDPAQKAELLAKLAPRVYGVCRPLTESLKRPPDELEVRPLLERMAKALEQCECKVDLPALKKTVWMTMAPQPLVSGVQVTFGGDTLELGADVPWSTAAEKVIAAAGKPVTLKARQ